LDGHETTEHYVQKDEPRGASKERHWIYELKRRLDEVLLHVSCLDGVFTGVFFLLISAQASNKSRDDAAAILSLVYFFHFSSLILH
jgi:hypothetical protein